MLSRSKPSGGRLKLAATPWRWALPGFLSRGRGGHVWDVDGTEWVDFPMALGAVLLGHAEPAVEQAIARQLRDGVSFTLMHPLEVEVAERIAALCPGVEAVRFAKTGSDATAAAVRVARSLTGRSRVLVCGYHGWHDWYAASTTRTRGVPDALRGLATGFPFNDLGRLAALLDAGDVAAVVLEPTGEVLPEPGFLAGVVELCRRAGAVSVFDEMVSGFRVAPGGVREKYGAVPDLSCYGKALGNGMPIAAVAGSAAVMGEFERVLVSGTSAGETLSLAAARAVLDAVAGGEVQARTEMLGTALLAGFRASIHRHGVGGQVRAGGEPTRPVLAFPAGGGLARGWVQQCFADAGALCAGVVNVCARHTDQDVALALAAFDRACAGLAGLDDGDLADRLGGGPAEPPLRAATAHGHREGTR